MRTQVRRWTAYFDYLRSRYNAWDSGAGQTGNTVVGFDYIVLYYDVDYNRYTAAWIRILRFLRSSVIHVVFHASLGEAVGLNAREKWKRIFQTAKIPQLSMQNSSIEIENQLVVSRFEEIKKKKKNNLDLPAQKNCIRNL